MKRFLIVMSFLFPLLEARASEETWLKPDNQRSRTYLAPEIRWSRTSGQMGIWPGARLGWTLGSTFSAGLEAFVLANEIRADIPDTSRLNMAVGGLVLEAIPGSDRMVHGVYSVLIGAGGTSTGDAPELEAMSNNSFIVVEPRFAFEFNLTHNVRISPGVGYVWISGDVPGVRSKWQVSETAFNVTVKLLSVEQ
jgi:hypothetical protein